MVEANDSSQVGQCFCWAYEGPMHYVVSCVGSALALWLRYMAWVGIAVARSKHRGTRGGRCHESIRSDFAEGAYEVPR